MESRSGSVIRSTVDGELRTITLDRPARRNALTWEGLATLQTTVQEATEPVLYLHGAGDAFCAGADLDTVDGLDRERAVEFARQGQAVAAELEAYDGAVVAGIDGPARGGGVELALACDVRVGTPDATLAENGVSLGLFGAWGGTARLPAIVGDGTALDFTLSGRVLSAKEALETGLLSRVVTEPRRVAEEIAANDSHAVRTVKHRICDRSAQTTQERREADAFGALVARRQRSTE